MSQAIKNVTKWFLRIGLIFFLVESALAFDQQHSEWNSIVKESVSWSESSSSVDYKSLRANPKGLNQYLKSISDVKRTDFDQWTREQQLAFLINAYNAWTIHLIVKNYPVKSIKDIGGFFLNPWKQKFFKLFGAESSLDWLEHEKIRPQYKEPRIHFALVCASKGCPGLRKEAFTAENLNENLENSTTQFLKDSSRNRYDPKKKELFLSLIFKWYKEDFIKAKGSVQQFVIPYLFSVQEQAKSDFSKIPIQYLDYDWTLNEK